MPYKRPAFTEADYREFEQVAEAMSKEIGVTISVPQALKRLATLYLQKAADVSPKG